MSNIWIPARKVVCDGFFTQKLMKRSFKASNHKARSTLNVFDRKTKYLQRERAASNPDHHVYDYIKDEIAYRISDRILDITKEFKVGLDLGCSKGFIAKHLPENTLSHLHMMEFSPGLLELSETPKHLTVTKHCLDEESPLPFEEESLDIVFSNMSLHWINDLPFTLKEVNRVLKKDGVFIGSMFGGDTLYELRSSLVLAELEREGGFASHISPFTKCSDIGSLLNQAGFTLLTIDTDDIVVRYPSMLDLMFDLKGMAENNSSLNRKAHLHRDSMLAAEAIYKEMYGKDEKGVPATFEIISMIGWKPDPTNPEHIANRGSGTVSFDDLHRLSDLAKEKGLEGRVKFMQELENQSNNPDEKPNDLDPNKNNPSGGDAK